MNKKEIQIKIEKFENEIKPLRDQLNEIHKQEAESTKIRIELCYRKQDKFEPEELVFSATARCNCGAGLAYPNDIGVWGSWHCANVLTGKAKPSEGKHKELQFQSYSVKSENQPSAQGSTTRPKKED